MVKYKKKKYLLRKNAISQSNKKSNRNQWKDDIGGVGYEILEEKTSCYDCKNKFKIKNDE